MNSSSGASSPNSLRSAPMEESDSDSDAGADMYDDGGERYAFEGKFVDAVDKAEIMAMPEIKREELLAERAAQAEKSQINRALRMLLKGRGAAEKKAEKKRKASAADLDGDQRKTSRQRTKLGGGKVGEARSGIDSLKRARAEKTAKQRRRDEDKELHGDSRRNTQDNYSDEDADGDSEVEWDDGKLKSKRSPSPELKDTEPATLQDIERVRVGRTRFGMVCFYPGFNETIGGCFARISIGADKETGQNIYRMALIKGFTEDRPYAIETPNGKRVQTTQYAKAAHGKSERSWPFITCSDSPFTEAEWHRYQQTCRVEGVALPTQRRLMQKIDDINALVNRSWTEEELQTKLLMSGALVNRFVPLERKRLSNLVKEYEASGDLDNMEKAQAELDGLDGPKLAYNTTMTSSPKKPVTGAISQQDRLAILNRQHKRENVEKVRQAQIAERRKVKQDQMAAARGEVVAEDTSRRLKTRAKFKHDVADAYVKRTDSDASGANTPTARTPKFEAKKPSTPLPLIAKLQAENSGKKGFATLSRPLMDDDIIGSIDLGIDIEL
ncbi:RNA polymerase II transcription elongation factor-like protein Rtf1p [Amylocarpus encephaloides]|uniref:RNA polymerase II transcription elongation factor-like protein Rtf1p n=1 Tax=Amylocarpus encephaloides TaxID=45428 RepID=A0A9P7YU02_9HELO|nr:RNA polymerase II transcription elongation factor-like protein Rtf1p [Amylocarpus encephaloides]